MQLQPNVRGRWLAIAACLCVPLTFAQAPTANFPPEHIANGAKLYEDNCAPCHGSRMQNAGAGDVFDLRKFPPDQRSRFVNSVANGKNNMPPWRSMLSQEEIGYLYAYVVAGEKK